MENEDIKTIRKKLFNSTLRALNGLVFILLAISILYNKSVNDINPDNFTMFTALTSLIIAYSNED